METLKALVSQVSNALDFNQAILSGCIDIIVSEQEDGVLKSSPFHVRFGKLKVFKAKEKLITLNINGVEQEVKMKCGSAGEGYFEEEKTTENRRIKVRQRSDSIGSVDMSSNQGSDDNSSDLEVGSDKEADKKTAKGQEPVSGEYKAGSTVQETKQGGDERKKVDAEPSKPSRWLWGSSMKSKEEKETKQKKDEEGGDTLAQPSSNNKPPALEKKFRNSVETELNELWGNNGNKKSTGQPSINVIKINEAPVEEESIQIDERRAVNEVAAPEVLINKNKPEELVKESTNTTNPSKGKGIIKSFLGIFSKEDKKEDKKEEKKEAGAAAAGPVKKEEGPKELITVLAVEQPSKIQNSAEKAPRGGLAVSQKETEKLIDVSNPDVQAAVNNEEEEEENEEADEEIALSLCKHLIHQTKEEKFHEIFDANRVSFEKFSEDPVKILEHPNLLIKVLGTLYEWNVAAPLIVSLLAFKQPLDDTILFSLTEQKKNASFFSKIFSSKNKKPTSNQPSAKQHLETTPPQNKHKKQAAIAGDTLKSPKFVQEDKQPSPTLAKIGKANELEKLSIAEGEVGEKKRERLESQDEEFKSGESSPTLSEKSEKSKKTKSLNSKMRKTLRPNSETLKKFNLKPGRNKITYSVDDGSNRTVFQTGFIFLWPHNAKIVVSDIDGTITKSDVLGQLMPFVGKDWTHAGVTSFFQNIKKNGYFILYLTARAIGQSEQTRQFLNSVIQDDVTLPEGPVIMSPDRLLPSFTREVIHKKPEVFKIVALRDVKNLFQTESPFYAGFGNRDTDAVAYRSVGINMGKIFIINPDGNVHQLNNTYIKSYPSLNQMVDYVFPPLCEKDNNDIADDYYGSSFWKIKHPNTIDIEGLL